MGADEWDFRVNEKIAVRCNDRVRIGRVYEVTQDFVIVEINVPGYRRIHVIRYRGATDLRHIRR